MEVPIDYHILFLAMTFIMFIITIFLLFMETTLEKAVAANILIMFNFVLCMIEAYVFSAVDLYAFDTEGALVHNVYSGMHYFSWLFVVLGYINIMLLVYCVYLYIKKPWTEIMGDEPEIQYQGPPF